MVASIVPQNGKPESQKDPWSSVAATFELYEIKWKKIVDGSVLIRPGSGTDMNGNSQQAAGEEAGVNFSSC